MSAMEVDPSKVPRRKAPIDLLSVYLKSTYFLNSDGSKFACVGIFKDRGLSLGILFKDKKGTMFWSRDVFSQLAPYFAEVTKTLNSKKQTYFKIDSKEDIKVFTSFGKRCVILFDGTNSVSLSEAEWNRFCNSLTLLNREIYRLFYFEDIIKSYILEIISSEQDFVEAPCDLPLQFIDILHDEVKLGHGSS